MLAPVVFPGAAKSSPVPRDAGGMHAVERVDPEANPVPEVGEPADAEKVGRAVIPELVPGEGDHLAHLRYVGTQAPPDGLAEEGIREPMVADVSRVVCRIRQRKLPDPSAIGNAGSFFKNPVVEPATYERLRANEPGLRAFPLPDGQVKLAAAWLIERAGWKGVRRGNTGTYDKHALVLVNHGGATGQEVYALSEAIIRSVAGRFGIWLEREVNVV